MDFEQLLAVVPDIGDKLAREMAIARLAHASGAADERNRLRGEMTARHERQHEAEALAGHYLAQRDEAREQRTCAERLSRGMFVARLENMQQNGDRWLTVAAVLALLNDCDMLASNEGPNVALSR